MPANHVPFPRPVELLGPGAQRLAKKSANRLSSVAVAQVLQRLAKLIRDEREAKLRQGDLLISLVDHHHLRPVDLARELKCRANHLSEAYHVAKLFPRTARRIGIPYTHYWMAMRTVRKFKTLMLDPTEVLAEINRHGFTQHRDVTRFFSTKLLRHENLQSLDTNVGSSPSSGSLNRCYHARFQSFLSMFDDASIKLIWADPPYSNYRRVADGRYTGGSVTRTDCDSETAAEAIAVTVDLLRDWGRKLMPGGVLLLWQSAGTLRDPIADAIESCGWEVNATVIWDKGSLQPGNFESPYSVQTEWLWVLNRRGDRLRNHDNSSRSDIIRCAPVWKSAETADHSHAFEKPADLCRFFAGKHTFAGDLVFEPFGCTGSMCVAAADMNRRWVYSESHARNFEIGAERLARVKSRRPRPASNIIAVSAAVPA